MHDQSLPERLAELERRIEALEHGEPPTGPPAVADGSGTVRYSGDVHLHGDVVWEIALDAGAVLSLDDGPRVAVLAALGHPARARIVRSLLTDGAHSTAALQAAADLASTGQLYHHLRSLTHSGLVEQDGRGSYRIAPRAVVPALVLLSAAADVAGQLR
ncbi:ArsR/SmtB family transcription factor [Pseudonocardia alaniniphila]|uniref:Helix-turn-helix domain-containing protein n=1 Tax=Pseudonocardia alaniniphila TaxID=75291 RepID=A0ABS9TU46_9PSEU|nr:helix-turn-helix domain-containing protein [Pseudonocardia alaniniphila]MCH6172016.1 helix-turn-helix domain-containing protein [Pseudonocardia alaniniphila]